MAEYPPLDPSFRNRYMVDVEDELGNTREQFTLPAARAARAAYERPGVLGHWFGGARAVVPPTPWDPDRPRPELASPNAAETPFEYAVKPITNLGSAVRGAGSLVGGVFNPPLTPPERPVTGNLPPTERSQWEDTEYANRLRMFGLNTGLNMIGAGRLPGASPPGAVGTSGSAPTLRGQAAAKAWREGTAEERLRTTSHPFGPGGTPIRDMPKPIIEGEKKIKSTPIDVEKDLKNAELIFMPGDPTGATGRLMGFPGMTFENPVARLGGPGYFSAVAGQPGPQRLWASDKGPMTGIFNIAKGVEARGNVPWGVYMTGAKPYMDQSTQMVQTAIEAANATGVSSKANKHLVDVMRSDWNVPADKELLFPKKGLNDPEAVQWWLANQPMPQHSKLVKAMGTAEAEKLGFPNMSVLRVGNTDPRLLTAQPGSAGLMLGRIDTSKGLITPSYHPDYNTAIATSAAPYTFGRQLPPDVIAATMHQQRVNQIRPLREGQPSAYLNAPHLYYGAGGTAQKTEPVTNQWRDTVQNWLASNPEQRIGGVVLGAGANDPRSVALAAGLNAARDPQLGSTVRNAAEPIRAYHSSPHDFERFDLSKIGTGEGAQVYGHGIYAAENPKVSGQGGQYWQQFKNRFAYNPAEMEAINVLQNHNFDREKAISELTDLKRYQPGYIEGAISSADRARREAINAKNNEALELLKSGKIIGPRTYEVNIHARPEQMLDWDKPIREQPILDAAAAASKASSGFYPSPVSGKQFYYELAGGKFGNDAAASATLREAGIPGIRYLDEGSRIAGQAESLIKLHGSKEAALEYANQRLSDLSGYPKSHPDKVAWQEMRNDLARPQTSNYVIFDPGIIEIAKKYGIPGMLGAGAIGETVRQDRYGS